MRKYLINAREFDEVRHDAPRLFSALASHRLRRLVHAWFVASIPLFVAGTIGAYFVAAREDIGLLWPAIGLCAPLVVGIIVHYATCGVLAICAGRLAVLVFVHCAIMGNDRPAECPSAGSHPINAEGGA